VLIAGAANLFVAVIKLAAGLLAGSSAMLAEAAHSIADTLNQAFLLTSVHQSERPADRRHPFGHGQERYFWSLLAAFGIFIAGAGFSFFEGILALTRSALRRGRGHFAGPGGRPDPAAGQGPAGQPARACPQQPGHHAEGGLLRGHRGHRRAAARVRRARPAPADGV
jgi:Cation efflux family